MADIIDTRELHDRYNELQEKIQEAEQVAMEDGDIIPDPVVILTDDEYTEWSDLEYMEDNISDFWYGETLVNEDYFTEYAKQLAEDLGYTGRNIEGQTWPFTHIDWEAAADDLSHDYTEFTWRGITYLARA